MRFVSVRELRGKAASVLRELAAEHDIVVTSRGKPVALLSATSEAHLEQSLATLRRARALAAVTDMQQAALEAGADRLTSRQVDAEIASVRRRRSR